jgi:FAD/FMN-containing dehydrogenase
MPTAGIETAVEQIDRWPGSAAASPPVGLELNSWGGAIARVSSSATAFVHRDARFLGIFGATWSAHDASGQVSANRAWHARFYEKMSRYTSGYAYQNLIDPELANWQQAYYGSNYARLTRIKKRYDPDDLFRFRQGIG